jgi:glyoxylate/hydroxypyruvate reductase A
MALLIDVGHGGWMTEDEIREAVLAHLPGADVRTLRDIGDPADITMLAVSRLRDDLPARLPNLKLVQKLGAGVETIVAHAALPAHVRVARLKPRASAIEIAQYFLAYILRDLRHLQHYQQAQSEGRWDPVEPGEPGKTRVLVLGLGHIGGTSARLMRDLGFQVDGWSRSPKSIEGVTCQSGNADLPALLGRADVTCAILPSTPETRGLIDAAMLARFKPGARLINAGRGDLIDEVALVEALSQGRPGHAVLDVLASEPLPPDSALWWHPQVTITPHVSGWHLGEALADVAENLRRLDQGAPLLHEVDRAKGY